MAGHCAAICCYNHCCFKFCATRSPVWHGASFRAKAAIDFNMIDIIQYSYRALKSYKGYRGTGLVMSSRFALSSCKEKNEETAKTRATGKLPIIFSRCKVPYNKSNSGLINMVLVIETTMICWAISTHFISVLDWWTGVHNIPYIAHAHNASCAKMQHQIHDKMHPLLFNYIKSNRHG